MSKLKGWFGEKILQVGLWVFLDSKRFKRAHNLILSVGNITTQIDHVLISKFGIFVVETKHFGGRIFGSEKDDKWTQSFGRGRTYRFQNPLRQNYRHTKALSEKLAISHGFVHSIIVFIGPEVKFGKAMPGNVVIAPRRAAQYVRSFTKVVFTDEELRRVENEIYGLQAEQVSNREHTENLKSRYMQSTNCPKCGSAMIRKVARKSSNKGKSFMACSSYPKCKYISPDSGSARLGADQ